MAQKGAADVKDKAKTGVSFMVSMEEEERPCSPMPQRLRSYKRGRKPLTKAEIDEKQAQADFRRKERELEKIQHAMEDVIRSKGTLQSRPSSAVRPTTNTQHRGLGDSASASNSEAEQNQATAPEDDQPEPQV